MSSLDAVFARGLVTRFLATSTGTAQVDGTTPIADDILRAQSATVAPWGTADPAEALTVAAATLAHPSAAPAAGQSLQALDASTLVWAQQVAPVAQTQLRIYRSSALNLVNGWQNLPMDAVRNDPDSVFDATSGGFIAKHAGYYFVTVRVRVNVTVLDLETGVRVNAGVDQALGWRANVTSLGGGGSCLLYLAVSDVCQPRAYTASAGSFAVTTNAFDTYMHAVGPF